MYYATLADGTRIYRNDGFYDKSANFSDSIQHANISCPVLVITGTQNNVHARGSTSIVEARAFMNKIPSAPSQQKLIIYSGARHSGCSIHPSVIASKMVCDYDPSLEGMPRDNVRDIGTLFTRFSSDIVAFLTMPRITSQLKIKYPTQFTPPIEERIVDGVGAFVYNPSSVSKGDLLLLPDVLGTGNKQANVHNLVDCFCQQGYRCFLIYYCRDQNTGQVTYDTAFNDVALLLSGNRLGLLYPYSVVGYGQGSLIAQRIAIEFPTFAKHLIVDVNVMNTRHHVGDPVSEGNFSNTIQHNGIVCSTLIVISMQLTSSAELMEKIGSVVGELKLVAYRDCDVISRTDFIAREICLFLTSEKHPNTNEIDFMKFTSTIIDFIDDVDLSAQTLVSGNKLDIPALFMMYLLFMPKLPRPCFDGTASNLRPGLWALQVPNSACYVHNNMKKYAEITPRILNTCLF